MLAAVALTGALLIVWKPVDRWLNPALFAAATPDAPPAPLDAARATLRQAYGPASAFTLRPPRESGDTLWAYVDGAFHGLAYLDPSTARLLGQRGEHEGAANWMFELHSALLLGEAGRGVMAVLAATYFFLLATGAVLWWPRQWRQALAVQLRGGLTRALFDLHKAGGALLGLFIAVSIASGVWMAWKPLSAWVTVMAGHTPLTPPRVPAPAGKDASLDAMAAQARRLFPDARIGYIGVPPAADQPVRLRLKLPADPHPNGLTSLYFHPGSGELLAVHRFDRLQAGARHTSWIYPLHIGELGGPWHKAANAALGFALAGLGISGLWLWWRRRRRLR
ncbi:iron-regulated membrane protein-like protein [Ramlibacter tataouinensis TTB310]|uniref:Iron-regulated membrane protein-like protein n=1 Tax=Ramlibacter tataouinensis (strain ATCC BAA-407 / DSM 14655 / LMG 21543 / TTB310) TaxID=365046 RepID=F5Y1U0_RAMTT|nr:iron-regulated membrane protein-like protein [Ramlibacter tataouinensis TTB310]